MSNILILKILNNSQILKKNFLLYISDAFETDENASEDLKQQVKELGQMFNTMDIVMTTFFKSLIDQDSNAIDQQHQQLINKLCSVVKKANNERCALRNILQPTSKPPIQTQSTTHQIVPNKQPTTITKYNGEDVMYIEETRTVTTTHKGKAQRCNKTEFRCLTCNKTTNNFHNFKQHNCHKVMPQEPTNTIHQCMFCSRICSTNHNKVSHERQCGEKRECDYCKKRIEIKNLKGHMKWCKIHMSRNLIWCKSTNNK